jgi:hypothetical protein
MAYYKRPQIEVYTPLQINKNKESCERHANNNKSSGNVIVAKMYMNKPVGLLDTYINVYPNNRHGGLQCGLGLPSLSPMRIGPIDHGQPELPMSINLENFHQGNKVFPCEVYKDKITQKFYDTRYDMYRDPIPHRHKYTKSDVPLYSIWVDKLGVEHRVDYITSRQFYCNFYERHTINNPDFIKLQEKLKDGFNLRICGYDGYPITMTPEEHYLDPSKPFGHELVLYTMLVCEPKDYPWRKYKTYDF